MTVSKSGISGSVGVGGLRVTNSSRGTFFSASPGAGIYFRERIGGRQQNPTQTAPTPNNVMQEIASDQVSQMVEHAAIIERINRNETRGSWLPWAGIAVSVVSLFVLSASGLLVGAVIIPVSFALRRYLISKSPVQLEYEFDEEDRKKYEALQNAFGALARCQRLWQVNAFGSTNDWKRNAGATQIIRRSSARVGRGTGRSFTARVEVFHVRLRNETMYFLPDMILVQQKRKFGSVAYENLQTAHSVTRFNEEQSVPSDARVVGTTWRYVNKNGGPDKRFNNNRQIPVVQYGEVAMTTQSGLRCALMTSSPAAAEVFVAGIRFVQSFKPVQMLYLPQPNR